ncbi:LOW QUALITY PROTEIN: uncharacterized protein LOC128263364 [Drosophila gunungcola]|uniref:LOW QUALITY PROTEIN: uncharacterized protein LOC128263364 n=1 Tax=Drosophila gunungcola TaxID=103775 RepID=UPI0022E0D5D9|nr:LOW QUALITY PROTEIN: uncharacterized protein LOC128263364 [Drosophila gunungcola]
MAGREVDEDEDQDDDEDEHEEESALSSYSSQILILLTNLLISRCASARVASIFRLPAPKPESTIEFQTLYVQYAAPNTTAHPTIRRPSKTQRLLQFLCAIFYMRTKGGTRCRLWLVKVMGVVGWLLFLGR